MASIITYTTLPRMAKNNLLFVLTIPLTFVFLMSSTMKLSANFMMIMGFDGYGYPIAFMFFVGYAEFFGAFSLWLKRWALMGSMGLSVILLGASVTHLINGDPMKFAGPAYVLTPIMLLVTFYHWRAAKSESSNA